MYRTQNINYRLCNDLLGKYLTDHIVSHPFPSDFHSIRTSLVKCCCSGVATIYAVKTAGLAVGIGIGKFTNFLVSEKHAAAVEHRTLVAILLPH
jgi:hypothetical protein